MMRDAGLPERSGSDAYAKIEVTPTDGCYLSDPMTWAVKIDEPRTPEWVRDEWARVEDSARRQAKAWAREHIMRGDGGDYKVGAGEVLIVYGSPAKIRVAKDGVCQTRDTSAPRAIRVADGGVCHTRDTSAPGEIRVSKGGLCYTSDTSAPGEIRVSKGGECWTRDTSAPDEIRVAGCGLCWTSDSSAPRKIHVSSGGRCKWGSSVSSKGRIFHK